MGLTIDQIRDRTIHARHLMQRARQQKFAVGAFNIDNQETLIAVSRAAQKLNSPVLVEVSDGEVEAIGLENIRDMVDNYREEYGVEMYVNLDHSPSIEACKRAIDVGYEFIHIDISQADHTASTQQIIDSTKEVVEYARFTGALVESEPHYFGGSSNVHTEDINYDEIRKTFSTPQGAVDFVDATGIPPGPFEVGHSASKVRCHEEV
jgi:fructose-bisphosphate aldolase class II